MNDRAMVIQASHNRGYGVFPKRLTEAERAELHEWIYGAKGPVENYPAPTAALEREDRAHGWRAW